MKVDLEYIKKISERAKEVASHICGWDIKDVISVDIEYGEIHVNFEIFRRGEVESRSVYLTKEDMENPIEITLARINKIEFEKKEKERLRQEELKRNAEEQKLKKQKEVYLKLKKKFEPES